jgi:hypothetical protein
MISVFDHVSTATLATLPKATDAVTYSKAWILTENEVFLVSGAIWNEAIIGANQAEGNFICELHV